MKNIFYKPGDGWVGDTIPFAHDGKFYIFYLHDERKGNTEDEYGYRTSWNLLITEDGVNIKDCKVVLPVGGYDDADYACYTGSVIEGNDSKFHIFYTAQNNYNPKYHRNGRPLQYVDGVNLLSVNELQNYTLIKVFNFSIILLSFLFHVKIL